MRIRSTLGFLQKHLVAILLVYERNGHREADYITAFVLSVQDRWYLITAGHCLEDVENMTNSGWKLQGSHLLDSFHLPMKAVLTVPFSYCDARPTRLNHIDAGYDYGILTLWDHYRRLLESNGIRPLPEEAWLYDPPENVDTYCLLGLPRELTQTDFGSESMVLEPIVFEVERMREPPPSLTEETQLPRFYGRIWLDDELNSIKGVSGGPIFAIRKAEPEQFQYWLVAIQSSWWSQSRYIAACYTRLLGKVLTEYVRDGN